jgi:hypothetical protein
MTVTHRRRTESTKEQLMTIVRDAETLMPTQRSTAGDVMTTVHDTDTVRVAIPNHADDSFAGTEYLETTAPAELKSVAKALALIAGAVFVIGACAVAGVAYLTTPLPEHTVVHPAVVRPDTKPSAVTPTASAPPRMVAAPPAGTSDK